MALDLPVPGGDAGTWDEKLNAALTLLDAEKLSAATAAATYLAAARQSTVVTTQAELLAALSTVTKGVGVPSVAISVPPGVEIDLTATVTIDRIGVVLTGAGRGNPGTYPTNPGKGSGFRWAGPAGQPMFRFLDAQNVYFSDLYIRGNDTAAPSELFYFDSAGGESGTNEYLTVERVTFGYSPYVTSAGSAAAIHVRFGGLNANNDQFRFVDCQFSRPTVAAFQIDNTQSIWGVLENCMFAGNSAAKGLVTSSAVTLINPQFDACTVDFDIRSSARVTALGWQSERALQLAVIDGDGARLDVFGGVVDAATTTGSRYVDITGVSTGGGLTLDGVRVRGTGGTKKLYARGRAGGATPGSISVRNCHMAQADLDIAAGASNSGSILVDFHDQMVSTRQALVSAKAFEARSDLAWQAWTPTVSGTGWALGDATVVARYRRIGSTVEWMAQVTWGSTSTFGTGALNVSLPVTAASAGVQAYPLTAKMLSAGVSLYGLGGRYNTTTTAQPTTTGTNGIWGNVTATAPVTWKATDVLYIGGTYEAA